MAVIQNVTLRDWHDAIANAVYAIQNGCDAESEADEIGGKLEDVQHEIAEYIVDD